MLTKIFDICLHPKTFQTDRRTLVNYLRYKKKPKQNKYFFLKFRHVRRSG